MGETEHISGENGYTIYPKCIKSPWNDYLHKTDKIGYNYLNFSKERTYGV